MVLTYRDQVPSLSCICLRRRNVFPTNTLELLTRRVQHVRQQGPSESHAPIEPSYETHGSFWKPKAMLHASRFSSSWTVYHWRSGHFLVEVSWPEESDMEIETIRRNRADEPATTKLVCLSAAGISSQHKRWTETGFIPWTRARTNRLARRVPISSSKFQADFRCGCVYTVLREGLRNRSKGHVGQNRSCYLMPVPTPPFACPEGG